MPTPKKKPAPKKATMKAAAKKTAPKKAVKKTAPKKAKPAPPPTYQFTPAERGFIAAIKKAPDDLTAHLVYADWLAEQNQGSRAAALRAWAEFVRIPVTAVGMKGVVAAYHNYRDALKLKDAEWVEAMEKVRPWIPVPLAEKIVRVCLDDMYGVPEPSAWAVNVSPCFFDDRWSGGYKGEAAHQGKLTRRSGAFYIDQVTGSVSGHVSSL
jgi:uncharacterized protein (TIGR02996 family)